MLETADKMSLGDAGTSKLPTIRLVVCGRHGVRTVPLQPDGELVIGRHESCQLSLPDPSLSRYHARFVGRADAVGVEDLGSRHGTWLADKRIERAVLRIGSSVRLADVVATVTVGPDPFASVSAREPPALVPEALYLNERMRAVRALLHRTAQTDLPVVILGETGTGKELAVRELHLASRRRQGPLRVLNCAAIPTHLVESTLFGHERGAFTGADRARAGIFEEAKGGTVFLDEVGELSLAAQAALLRVLESGRLTRIGGSREVELDVRVAAATHRDLRAMTARGEFRTDLLHRLFVMSIELPPLRDRRDEIGPLAELFLSRAQSAAQLDARALARLQEHDWPGNVRELRNAIARAAALAQGLRIMESDLPETVRIAWRPQHPQPIAPHQDDTARAPTLRSRIASVERAEVQKALVQTGGNQRRAAVLLGIPLRTFERRLRAWRAQGDGAPATDTRSGLQRLR